MIRNGHLFTHLFFGNQVKTFNPAQVQEQCDSVTSVRTK